MSSSKELLVNSSKRARITPRFDVSLNRLFSKDKGASPRRFHSSAGVVPRPGFALFSYPTPTITLRTTALRRGGRDDPASIGDLSTSSLLSGGGPSGLRWLNVLLAQLRHSSTGTFRPPSWVG